MWRRRPGFVSPSAAMLWGSFCSVFFANEGAGGCCGCYSTGSGNELVERYNELVERYLLSVVSPRVFGFVTNSGFDASGCGGSYSVRSGVGTTKNPFLFAGSGGGGSATVLGLPAWNFFYRSLDSGDGFMVVCLLLYSCCLPWFRWSWGVVLLFSFGGCRRMWGRFEGANGCVRV